MSIYLTIIIITKIITVSFEKYYKNFMTSVA